MSSNKSTSTFGSSAIAASLQARRDFLRSSAASMAVAGAGLLGAAPIAAFSQTRVVGQDAVPKSGEYVVRNAIILTLDPTLGDLAAADIHVRGDAIVAVGTALQVPASAEVVDGTGMIVMPGLCDSHWHMWNTLFKNMVTPRASYAVLKNALGPHHTPLDYYRANRLALTEAIDAGITTVLNYAHHTQSPAHVDAEIRALVESGLRGRYAYGGADPTPINQTIDLADFERAYKEWFDRPSAWKGRVGYGIAGRAPDFRPGQTAVGIPEKAVYQKEYSLAARLGVPLVIHSGQTPGRRVSPAALHAEGFADKSTVFVHGIVLSPEDRATLVQTGAALSVSFGNEFRSQRGGDVRQQTLLLLQAGGLISLSCDASSLNRTSIFEQMRIAFAVMTPHEGTPTEKLAAVTARQCLQMASTNGLKALGFGEVAGTLSPGKRADFIMLRATDLNLAPMGELDKTIVHSATNANVDSVVVDGRFLKRGGKILSVDAQQVRREAVESLYQIRKRAGGAFAPVGDAPGLV
ncbi:MAG: amidohydrolase family protein [Rhodoferax sp.]|jgi:5-methylthioadenosine/S-adenosylhomocysteine deaminase|nr:amidohydrolase family protein [Rhodoferax sp.]